MPDLKKLRMRIRKTGFSIDEVASHIGVSRSSMYRKIEGNGRSLTVQEAAKIATLLKLSTEEIIDIFFDSPSDAGKERHMDNPATMSMQPGSQDQEWMLVADKLRNEAKRTLLAQIDGMDAWELIFLSKICLGLRDLRGRPEAVKSNT